jgi:hypothetical protein
VADASYLQVAAVKAAVEQANRSLASLQMQQVQLQNVVDHVANSQDVTRSELQELRTLFDDFLLRDELNRNLQLAQTEIIAVRQELETKYGHFGEVRRLATGTLQGMDAGIVKQETLQAIAEELMVTAPGYWLAPALVALAAWIRDDEALARRALTEALRRDNDKTSLFFALVLRRQQRNQATARWLGQYVARQDPSRLSQEFTVVLDATATGALGPEAKPLVMGYLTEWYERLGNDPAVVAGQVVRWRQLIDGMRSSVLPQFTVLPAISPTWDRLKDLYERATVHGRAEAHFRSVFDRPLRHDPKLAVRVDEILTNLVGSFDSEEYPHRRREIELNKVIEHGGNKRAAAAAATAALSVHEDSVDFLTLLTNAGFFPERVGASDGTQRLAIALAKDWIVEADGQLEAETVAAMPAGVDLAVEGWTGTIDQYASEHQLVASVQDHIEAETRAQIAAIRFTGGPLAAAVAAGVALFLALITLVQGGSGGALFFLLIALVAGGYAAVQYNNLQPRRDHLRKLGEQRRRLAAEQVRGAIAETLDWRTAWERELDRAAEFRAYMNTLSRDAFIARHHDQGREVHV